VNVIRKCERILSVREKWAERKICVIWKWWKPFVIMHIDWYIAVFCMPFCGATEWPLTISKAFQIHSMFSFIIFSLTRPVRTILRPPLSPVCPNLYVRNWVIWKWRENNGCRGKIGNREKWVWMWYENDGRIMGVGAKWVWRKMSDMKMMNTVFSHALADI